MPVENDGFAVFREDDDGVKRMLVFIRPPLPLMTPDDLLDWYATEYDFERERLHGFAVATIEYAMPTCTECGKKLGERHTDECSCGVRFVMSHDCEEKTP